MESRVRGGWYKVLVCFLVNFIVFGMQNSHETDLKTRIYGPPLYEVKNSISLFNSIGNILTPLIGVVSGILSDRLGYRIVVVLGVLLYGTGYIIAGLYFGDALGFFGYGFLTGLGAGLIQIPIISLIPQLYNKNMGLASALAYSGIGLGTLLPWSPSRNSISRINYLLFITGIPILIIFLFFSLLLRRPAPTNSITFQDTILSIRTNKSSFNFMMLWFAALVMAFGSSVPIYYLNIKRGSNSSLHWIYLFQAIGAILFGKLADRYGPLIIMITTTFLSGIVCLTLGRIDNGSSPAFYIIYNLLCSSPLCLLPLVNYKYIVYAKPNILYTTSNGLLYSAVGLGMLISRMFIIPLNSLDISDVIALYTMLWSGWWAIISSMILAILKLSLHPNYKVLI